MLLPGHRSLIIHVDKLQGVVISGGQLYIVHSIAQYYTIESGLNPLVDTLDISTALAAARDFQVQYKPLEKHSSKEKRQTLSDFV